MSFPRSETTAARVSDECRAAADALTALQESMTSHVLCSQNAALLHDLQALDGVQQTLDDLATLFAALAESGAAKGLCLTEDVTEGIKQTTLRQRLLGKGDGTIGNTVELF